MSNFRVGQKVVCVDDSRKLNMPGFRVLVRGPMLVKRKEYIIRDIFWHSATEKYALRLVGVDRPICPYLGIEGGWAEHRFRPAVDIKDDIALFHALCPGLPVVPPAILKPRVRVE